MRSCRRGGVFDVQLGFAPAVPAVRAQDARRMDAFAACAKQRLAERRSFGAERNRRNPGTVAALKTNPHVPFPNNIRKGEPDVARRKHGLRVRSAEGASASDFFRQLRRRSTGRNEGIDPQIRRPVE